MRQKCEYCKTSPELNEKGICPNCGAGMVILADSFSESRFQKEIADVYFTSHREIMNYPRPSGSFANISPNWTMITGAHRPFDEINRFILGE